MVTAEVFLVDEFSFTRCSIEHHRKPAGYLRGGMQLVVAGRRISLRGCLRRPMKEVEHWMDAGTGQCRKQVDQEMMDEALGCASRLRSGLPHRRTVREFGHYPSLSRRQTGADS